MKTVFSLTPKALRVEELRGQGHDFDDALLIADREYSSNGMELQRFVQPQPEQRRAS